MNYSDAAPCRHRGAPSEHVIAQVVRILKDVLPANVALLGANGLTVDEYVRALPSALERFRGSMAASNRERRDFVTTVLDLLVQKGTVLGFDVPQYGEGTVYRLRLKDGRHVGVIQKGCPDGHHSSAAWKRPDWADELYLWWVCDSLRYDPGEHVWKGINRVSSKVSEPGADQLDGVVFFNHLCGTPERPCPKMDRAVEHAGMSIPPPCIYVFPRWDAGADALNWRGELTRTFPACLLSAFGIAQAELDEYTGSVGFRLAKGIVTSTEIVNRFGEYKISTVRG